jgi:hypothetical protein
MLGCRVCGARGSPSEEGSEGFLPVPVYEVGPRQGRAWLAAPWH